MPEVPLMLVISIDVEEDSWGQYHPDQHKTENVSELTGFQEMCGTYGVRPTYLVTYPVAAEAGSRQVLTDLLGSGGCEIGAHLHPWCTPPLNGASSKRNSMLCNLSETDQGAKLTVLTEFIEASVGVRPRSFRAGRWAISKGTASQLEALGYVVDSSVCPFTDWTSCYGPDFSRLQRRDAWETMSLPLRYPRYCSVVEIPPTIGFLQQNQRRANEVYRFIRTHVPQKLHLLGALYRLGMLNRVWLSPEHSTADEMVGLCRRLVSDGAKVLNMSFHSVSLAPGIGPFVASAKDREQFMHRLRAVIEFALDQGAVPVTLTEAAAALFPAHVRIVEPTEGAARSRVHRTAYSFSQPRRIQPHLAEPAPLRRAGR